MSSPFEVSSSLKTAALEYAQVKRLPGFPVCWPDAELKCGCGRGHTGREIGKVPLTPNGFKDASIEPGRINEWWDKHPLANVAIAIPRGYLVLDVDVKNDGYTSLARLQDAVGLLPPTWLITTGSGGSHYWYGTTEAIINGNAPLAGYHGIDIKAYGGYVLLPPSLHISGNCYEVAEEREIAEAPAALIELINRKAIRQRSNGQENELIPFGSHDKWLHSQASTYRGRGDTEDTIVAKLRLDLKRLKDTDPIHPYTDKDLFRLAHSVVVHYSPNVTAYPYGNKPYLNNIYERNNDNLASERNKNATENATAPQQTLCDAIENWIKDTNGWWETQELDRDLGITQKNDKNNRREILLRLEQRRIIERHAKSNKEWRFINRELVELDYKAIKAATPLDIEFPLGISRLVNLHHSNLVVVAGTTNAGKTALLLEFMKLNNNSTMPLYYFYSEAGGEELRARLDRCEGMSPEEFNFRAFSRSVDFADVIAPDCINVIDYLEMTTDFFMVNSHLTAICNKVGCGLAIVAIQKKQGQRFGRGGEFSAEKARLYLSLDEAEGRNVAKVKIIKGKSWAIKSYNPNGLVATFRIENGWISEIVDNWSYESDE